MRTEILTCVLLCTMAMAWVTHPVELTIIDLEDAYIEPSTSATAGLLTDGDYTYHNGIEGAGQIPELLSSPVYAGQYALRFDVLPSVHEKDRTEYGYYRWLPFGTVHYTSFAMYVPSDVAAPESWHIFYQWWQFSPASPPMSLDFMNNGNYSLVLRNDEDSYEQIYTAPLPRDVWIKFVFEYRFGLEGSGYVKLWVDGDKKLDYTGTIGWYSSEGLYRLNEKFGIYRGGTQLPSTVYFDEIRTSLSRSDMDLSGDLVLDIDDFEIFTADWLDAPKSVGLSDYLVSRYEFEGTWNNSVAGGYAAGPRGGAVIETVAQRGSAANLHLDRWLHVGYDPKVDGLGMQMTMAVWVRSTTVNWSANNRIMGKGYSWTIQVQNSANAGVGILNSVSNTVLTGTAQINDGQWHHIAATFDAATGERKLYVDGVLDVQDVVAVPGTAISQWASGRYAIAARATAADAAANIYRGYVDDVRIYSKVLTGDQIAEIISEYIPRMDFTGDLLVNYEDFVIFANEWAGIY